MASKLAPVAYAQQGDSVRFHGNAKAERGNMYRVVRSGSDRKGGVIVRNVKSGKVKTLPRYVPVFIRSA